MCDTTYSRDTFIEESIQLGIVHSPQDTVKENLDGETIVVETCTGERDRIAALEKWFGISLTEAEIRGISGWKIELHGWSCRGILL